MTENGIVSTIFDRVIANSVIQSMHYKNLNLLSKLTPKFDIHLHIKVGISHNFSGTKFIKLWYASRGHARDSSKIKAQV